MTTEEMLTVQGAHDGLLAKIQRLQAALKPMAAIPLWRDTYPDAKCDMFADSMLSRCDGITVEDVRRARDLLDGQSKPE